MSLMPQLAVPCSSRTKVRVPVFLCRVAAGFPSPADDYLERPLDFNELLIAHPAATFVVKVAGDSMIGVGIFPGDLAVVDRSLAARDGNIILGILDGEFTIKCLRMRRGQVWLEAANSAYQPTPITEQMSFEVWGVVRNTIRML